VSTTGFFRQSGQLATFNDQTGTVFEHSAAALRKWFLAVYTYIRFNTSLRQLDMEIDVSYKTVYRRVQRFLRVLNAPLPSPEGPVEIDEVYVKAGLKGRERDQPSRSHGLSTHGRGTYSVASHQCLFSQTAAPVSST